MKSFGSYSKLTLRVLTSSSLGSFLTTILTLISLVPFYALSNQGLYSLRKPKKDLRAFWSLLTFIGVTALVLSAR